MFTKQVRFYLEGENVLYGGILVEDGNDSYVICGCCGSIIEMDDIEEIDEFENWIDISNEIIGG